MRSGKFISLAILILLSFAYQNLSYAQGTFAKGYKLEGVSSSQSSNLPISNSVSQIVAADSILWAGTGKGVMKSATFGASWENFYSEKAFANEGIFALAVNGDTIWASTGYDKDVGGDQTIQTGSGYAFSIDGGITWKHVNQPLDTCIQLPSSDGRRICKKDILKPYGINSGTTTTAVTTTVANVSYDIALGPGTVWVASWSSGLRKSTNNGSTWETVLLPLDNLNSLRPTDTLWSFHPSDTLRADTLFPFFDVVLNDNLKAFAVHVSDNGQTIWCGTAGGVNKSTDGGVSWEKFYNNNSQATRILSNWVYRIGEQHFQGKQRIWTTNWKKEPPSYYDLPQEYGVSYTDDDGRTWKNLLQGIKPFNFAFKDSIAYITTENGLYRTADGGLSFTNVSNIVDPVSHQIITTTQFISVGVIGDTVFVGTDAGIASTVDNGTIPFGSSWKIYRAYQAVGSSPTTYAYPNPFSPDLELVRIHYGSKASSASSTRNVSIEIFDFGMNHVRTLVNNAQRSASLEYDELWDGRNDDGRQVANGVYFYRIKVDSDDPTYGKILVLQ